VAEEAGQVIGWAVVHGRARQTKGWEPEGETVQFQQEENAYLEHLEVAPAWRGRGIGRRLLTAAEAEGGSEKIVPASPRPRPEPLWPLVRWSGSRTESDPRARPMAWSFNSPAFWVS
jgi:GNAT superfamily N-acetyltransferase